MPNVYSYQVQNIKSAVNIQFPSNKYMSNSYTSLFDKYAANIKIGVHFIFEKSAKVHNTIHKNPNNKVAVCYKMEKSLPFIQAAS